MIDDSDREDYFERIPEDKPKQEKPPKKPVYKPDDPRYYDEEPSQWDHLIPAPFRRTKLIFYTCGIIILFCIIYWFWVFFFTPVVSDADAYGYVEDIHKHGTVFTTYEGTMIPYRTAMDSTRVYDSDFNFSVSDATKASILKRMEKTGTPVKISYVIYRHAMPWRGQTKTIVTDIDTVIDVSKLLPIDRQPQYKP